MSGGTRIVLAALVMAAATLMGGGWTAAHADPGMAPIKTCKERPGQPRCHREITPETKPTTPSVLPKGCAYQATTKDQVRCVLAENGMDWAWWVADCIISHESGWNRYAVSPTSDYGLWQLNRINLYLLKGRPYYDPIANTEAAIALYRLALSYWGDGWRPWSSTARSCGVYA